MDINKTISYLMTHGGIPGNGIAHLKELDNQNAKIIILTNIRVRGQQSKLVELNTEINIPVPNEDGVFDIKGHNICLIKRARMKYPLDENGDLKVLTHVDELNIDSIEEIYAEIIGQALNVTAAPIRRGTGDFNTELFDTKIAASFASDKYGRTLPPNYNKSEVEAWNNTVVLSEVVLNERNPIPEGWENIFDLTTTPQSDKVCRVFTLCDGVTIKNKRLIPGNSKFSRLAKSAMFAPALAPTQMYKVWTTARSYVELSNPEPPLVSHEQADNSLIQGMNLYTAIVHDKYNQLDQITISKSAAEKMIGNVYTSEVVSVTEGGSELYVKIGDVVRPGQTIAKIFGGDGEAIIHARRLVRPATVTDIIPVTRITNGVKGTQYKIILQSSAPIVSGDKIMPRSGCKGCVVVVDDSEMPEVLQPNGTYKRAQLCVNPYPVAKRKNLSILLEMMCNEAGIDTIDINTNATMLIDLYNKGFGLKRPAKRHDNTLELPMTAGYVYWMRSNSLKEYRTYGVTKVKQNFQNLNPDIGILSGVRYNPTARLLMQMDKNCPLLDKVLMEKNFNTNITQLVGDLYSIVDTKVENEDGI